MHDETRGSRPPDLYRRRFLVLLGVGGAAGLLAACQQAAPVAAPTSAPAPKPTTPPPAPPKPTAAAPKSTAAPAAAKPATVSLNLPKPEMTSWTYGSNNPNYATQILHYVALEKGWFKEVGFDKIEVITGDEYLAGTVGGSLLLTQGDTDVVLSANAKGELLPIVGIYRSKEYRILGVGKGISSAQDLKGKKLSGGPPGSRNEYIMKQIVKRLGLDPEKDVEWIPVRGASDGRLQAIVAGQIAGGSLFPRHEKALTEAGGKFLVRDFVERPQEAHFGKAATIQKDPNLVTAYLAATNMARQWLLKDSATVQAHRDEALAIMQKHDFKITDAFKALYPIEMDQISPDGGFEARAMDQLVEESRAIGSIPQTFDWRKAVDLTPLHKAQAAVGLPARPTL